MKVLTTVIATPKARGGAVRAGLKLGDYITERVRGDVAKMAGEHDGKLFQELNLRTEIVPLPAITKVKDVASLVTPPDTNYENTLIWTYLCGSVDLNEYDVVHLHNAVPIAGMVVIATYCQKHDIPYCVTMHGIQKVPTLPDHVNMGHLTRTVYELTVVEPYWWVLRNAAHLFALSEADERLLRQKLPNQSTSVVPNGVELNLSNSVGKSVREQFNLPPEKPLLLYVGKLMASKGIDDLLEAVDRTSSEHILVMVGDEIESGYVDEISRLDDESVRYLGYVDQKDLDMLYREADLFVFPTRSDVYPLTVLEALASGTPVVSTTVGGIPDQVTEDVGTLVPPERPDKMVNAIERLLSDDNQRAWMARNAVKLARERFTWESVADAVIDRYQVILCDDTSAE